MIAELIDVLEGVLAEQERAPRMRTVVWHSPQWDTLVETGWLTHTVEFTPSGIPVARMVAPHWDGRN